MRWIGASCRSLASVCNISRGIGGASIREPPGGDHTRDGALKWVYNNAGPNNVGPSGAVSLVRCHSLPAGFGVRALTSSHGPAELMPLASFREDGVSRLPDGSAQPECISPADVLQVGSRAEVPMPLGGQLVPDGAG